MEKMDPIYRVILRGENSIDALDTNISMESSFSLLYNDIYKNNRYEHLHGCIQA